MSIWTKAQRAWVKNSYKQMRHDVMPEPFFKAFGEHRTSAQFRSLINNQGFVSGRVTRFQKGGVPFNKGTKGLMKANAGTFKKGNVSANERPLGFERISKDGYIEIKVPGKNRHTGYDGHFVFKHKYLWEKVHGAVPKGMAVTFIDGDKQNICIENLELITRAEVLQMNRHGINDLPKALLPVMRAIAKLEVATSAAVRA